MNETKNKITMVVFSGDMDKAMAAFIIATGAAASGMAVTMFFTFWGLQTIKKSVRTGKGFFGKMLGWMLKDINGLGPSKMNFGGIGRWMFKKMMKSKNVAMLPELRQMAIDLGVKLQACQMSMDVMEIRKEDLINDVQDVVGVAAMLEEAQQSTFTLFI
jgi:peroxiredoxin family protein